MYRYHRYILKKNKKIFFCFFTKSKKKKNENYKTNTYIGGRGTYPAALATFTQPLYIFSRAKLSKGRKYKKSREHQCKYTAEYYKIIRYKCSYRRLIPYFVFKYIYTSSKMYVCSIKRKLSFLL